MLSIAQYEDVDFASCGRDDESVGGLGAQAKPSLTSCERTPEPDRALCTGVKAVIASEHDTSLRDAMSPYLINLVQGHSAPYPNESCTKGLRELCGNESFKIFALLPKLIYFFKPSYL